MATNYHFLQKILLRVTTILVVFVAGYFVLRKINILPSPSEWFKEKTVRIEETPLLITEIKKIAELHTAKLYCEVIADSTVITPAQAALMTMQGMNTFPIIPPMVFSNPKKLVLIAKGRVVAGVDLLGLQPSNLTIKDDSVWLRIPNAKILETIANPSDFEVFIEEGEWSSTAVNLVKQKAIQQMLTNAEKQGLIKQANEKVILLMTNFLKGAGYKWVEVRSV